MRRRLAALLLGSTVALVLLGAAEARFRADEAALVYLWDSGRLFATRPGVGGANSASFHEREIPPVPAPGLRRVAVLGDSMTWGTGPAEEAWPRLAEQALGEGWQVLNFSHYGYDIAQSAAVLREHVWPYAPDLVVYAAYTNDPLPSRVIDVGGGPVWIAAEGLFPRPVRRVSAIVRRVEGALLAPTLDDRPDWAFYERHLDALVADTRAHATPLHVVGLVPWVLQDPDLAACSARLGMPGRCEEHAAIATEQARRHDARGLPHVPVLPAFQATDRHLAPPDRADWQHPGEAGHVIIADVVVAHLRGLDEVGRE